MRNALIDDVYLPLIGTNLAKQLGRDGASQGVLLLISPPGYGKTTLVEYVAGLLGFALVKVNGPALGQTVTSLDPAAAPDAAAAAELVKLNQAFAMGNNVVCYIDDIQHTSQELLSRFIPLCDATRRIEGVWRGRPRTFELAGRRFAMVMAGNPYTGSGERFELPDMLANRSDVYNLGDVVAGRADLFARSYLEVAAGSNPTLAPVVLGDRSDLDVFLRATQGEPVEARALSRPFPAADVRAITAALGHLVHVRDRLLLVNAAYIRSATLDDGLRGEPPFLLQGSYRNMAKLGGADRAGHDRRRGGGGARRPLPHRSADPGRCRRVEPRPTGRAGRPRLRGRRRGRCPAGPLVRGTGRRPTPPPRSPGRWPASRTPSATAPPTAAELRRGAPGRSGALFRWIAGPRRRRRVLGPANTPATAPRPRR